MVDARAFGSWRSPLTASWAAAASPRLESGALIGGEVWWGTSVPAEKGRTTVCRRRADGVEEQLLPAPWNARSSVHEYGGGSWTASDDGELFFVERSDERVWALVPGQSPRALTEPAPGVRFGGLSWQHSTLLAVREIHGDAPVPARSIVRIATEGTPTVHTVAAGSDFLAQPALSPDRARLAWVAWNHPDMPWDHTRIMVADLPGGEGVATQAVAVTDGETAALQPTWQDAHTLVFCDDPTGRWNLWRLDLSDSTRHAVAPADADTGGGLWVLGARWYAPLADGGTIAVRTQGSDELVHIDAGGRVTPIDLPARARLNVEATDGHRVLVSGAATGASGMWLVSADAPPVQVVGSTPDPEVLPYLPVARAVTVPGGHGPVHAFDFPPTNPQFEGLHAELPPYVVFVHGGPTSHVGGVADAKTAFFTSRGIGVLDVNYGGSTGYGRAYRERLHGQWGVVDVDDVAAAASGLVAAGVADGARLAIEGGSAGGWTVLAALVGNDVFSAGISRYGVGDARTLATDTHDFEARYLDGLIGPLPEADALYRERSPLSRPERFRVPLLLLQGSEDAVVPPAQSEAIRDALLTRGIPHAYVLYEGEGHGFRRAETIIDSLQREIAFLGQVFGFETPGIPPLTLA